MSAVEGVDRELVLSKGYKPVMCLCCFGHKRISAGSGTTVIECPQCSGTGEKWQPPPESLEKIMGRFIDLELRK